MKSVLKFFLIIIFSVSAYLQLNAQDNSIVQSTNTYNKFENIGISFTPHFQCYDDNVNDKLTHNFKFAGYSAIVHSDFSLSRLFSLNIGLSYSHTKEASYRPVELFPFPSSFLSINKLSLITLAKYYPISSNYLYFMSGLKTQINLYKQQTYIFYDKEIEVDNNVYLSHIYMPIIIGSQINLVKQLSLDIQFGYDIKLFNNNKLQPIRSNSIILGTYSAFNILDFATKKLLLSLGIVYKF